jgi:hypothetical protein
MAAALRFQTPIYQFQWNSLNHRPSHHAWEKVVDFVVRRVVDFGVRECHRPVAKPGAVGAQAETIVGMDEGKDQARSWVVKEMWWK